MNGKIFGLLGFAQKAGKIISGEEACKNQIIKGKVFLLIVSHDASSKTKQSMQSITSLHGIRCVEWGTKNKLGLSIGRSPRATVAVLDQHFASEIGKLLTVTLSN